MEYNIDFDSIMNVVSIINNSAYVISNNTTALNGNMVNLFNGNTFSGPIAETSSNGWANLKQNITTNVEKLNQVSNLKDVVAQYKNTDASNGSNIASV